MFDPIVLEGSPMINSGTGTAYNPNPGTAQKQQRPRDHFPIQPEKQRQKEMMSKTLNGQFLSPAVKAHLQVAELESSGSEDFVQMEEYTASQKNISAD